MAQARGLRWLRSALTAPFSRRRPAGTGEGSPPVVFGADAILDTMALDTMADAVIITDCAGTIGRFNAAAESCFGYAAAEAIGRPVEALIPEAPAPGAPRPPTSSARRSSSVASSPRGGTRSTRR